VKVTSNNFVVFYTAHRFVYSVLTDDRCLQLSARRYDNAALHIWFFFFSG